MKLIFYPVFFILVYSIQTVWLTYVSVDGTRPDLVLIFAFFCGLRFEVKRGVAAAGLGGFIQDCLSGGFLGINTFSKSIICFLVSAIRENILVESFAPIAIFTACISFIDGMIFYFVSTLFMDRVINENIFFNSLPIFALYNAFAGPPIFYLLNWFQKRVKRKTLAEFSEFS